MHWPGNRTRFEAEPRSAEAVGGGGGIEDVEQARGRQREVSWEKPRDDPGKAKGGTG